MTTTAATPRLMPVCQVRADRLALALKRALHARARPATYSGRTASVFGALLEVDASVRVVATDGHRLAVAEAMPTEASHRLRVLLTAEQAEDLRAACTAARTDLVEVWASEPSAKYAVVVHLRAGLDALFEATCDGSAEGFPAWERYLAPAGTTELHLPKRALVDAVAQFTRAIGRKRGGDINCGVRFETSPATHLLRLSHSALDPVFVPLDVPAPGKASVHLDPAYVRAALDALPGRQVTLRLPEREDENGRLPLSLVAGADQHSNVRVVIAGIYQ